jgi:hypothetical protein
MRSLFGNPLGNLSRCTLVLTASDRVTYRIRLSRLGESSGKSGDIPARRGQRRFGLGDSRSGAGF